MKAKPPNDECANSTSAEAAAWTIAISYRTSLILGIASVLGVVALQSYNSFECYQHDFRRFLDSLGFIALPMLPALVSLVTANPHRAVGASLFFAPWLVYAYYIDCARPYSDGGASMIYVAVTLWGLPCALLGAVLTPKRCMQQFKNVA